MYDYRPAPIPPALTRMMASMPAEDAARLQSAYQFAAAAHAEHRRDEGTPFIDHPVAVATILWEELGCRDADILVAALNHDVLEDCSWLTRDAVVSAIGSRATQLVADVTKAPAPDSLKEARDRQYLDHLRKVGVDARLLKLADRIHNLRSIPNANDPEKARRYLEVSRDEFYPLALTVDPTAARLIADACDAIEEHLNGPGPSAPIQRD